MNTNSKYWKEVWTLLAEKIFLPSVTLSSHPKKFVVPYETLNPDCVKQLSTTYTDISFLYDFLAANYNFFDLSDTHQLFLFGCKFPAEYRILLNSKKWPNSAEQPILTFV